MRVVYHGTARVRSWFSFVVSGCLHGGVLAWVILGGAGGERHETAPARSIYDQEIRPYEKRIVWYSLREKLPEVAPADRQPDARAPRAHVTAPPTMVAGARDKARTAIVGHERAVIEPGGREPQRAVDQQLPEGRPDQILAADYLGDPHAGVVHGAGQLVAWAVVLAPDREVAEIPARDGALGPEPSVVEREFLAVGHAQAPVDTDRVPDGGDRRAGIGAECGRIDGFVVGAALVGGAGGLDDVAPRPRARVDEAGPAEALQGGAVQGPPPALVVGRVGTSHVGALVPREPQPAQVGEHGLRWL